MAYPVSAAFTGALMSGGRIIAGADLLSNGLPVPGWTGLPVEQLTITAARSSTTRYRASVTLKPNGIIPASLMDPLSPVGNELLLTAGWQFDAEGIFTESAQLGIFPISTTTITSTAIDTTLVVDCYDRSWAIGRRGLTQPYSIYADLWTASHSYRVGSLLQPATPNNYMYVATNSGTSASAEPSWPTGIGATVQDGNILWRNAGSVQVPTLAQALADLVAVGSRTMPPFNLSIAQSTYVPPDVAWTEGANPWDIICNDLAKGAGFQCYFDRLGNFVAAPVPSPYSVDPVTVATPNINNTWLYGDAGQGLPYDGLIHVMTAENVFNDYTVIGNTSGNAAPPRQRLYDNDVDSPQYINGPYGDVPTFVTDDLITSNAAGLAEATQLLNVSLGQADMCTMTCIPNAAMDIDDVVVLTSTLQGLDAVPYIVDGFTLPVYAMGKMSVTLRRVIS